MGIIANAAFDNGGVVEGTITNHLADKEKKNLNISSIEVVETMHERKINMFNKADKFLILPGGIGTHEEFFEVLSWKQLQIHKTLEINISKRNSLRSYHTATHLLHQSLRDTLGDQVTQKGSLVSHDRLRFDFSHHKQISKEEVDKIEVTLSPFFIFPFLTLP